MQPGYRQGFFPRCTHTSSLASFHWILSVLVPALPTLEHLVTKSLRNVLPFRTCREGRRRTNNKFNPHMTPGLAIEPGPHWLPLPSNKQGCALRRITRSPKVPSYKIRGAQHKAYMKKVSLSGRPKANVSR